MTQIIIDDPHQIPIKLIETDPLQDPLRLNLINSYTQAITDLETIQTTANPTNAQVIAAVKREAQIMEQLLKFIKSQIV